MIGNPKATPIDPGLRDLLRISQKTFGSAGGDLPAKVLSYNRATQTVDAQPVVMVPNPQGGLKAASIARQVQVRWPAGATWSIVGDLAAGDFGWLRVAGADISTWKMQGAEQDPLALERKGSDSDVVFEPGSQPVSVPLASDAYSAGALVIKATRLLLGDSTASDNVALAKLVLSELENITSWASGHIHVDSVGGNTASPTTPPTAPASVAATKVWAI